MQPLKIDNISLSYQPGVPVLQEVSFEISSGEIVAAVGQSGSGKTSLLRTIAGFEKAQQGSIFLNGIDVSQLAAEKRKIGFVFQDLALFPHLTVAKNIAFGLSSSQNAKARVDELLALVGLEGLGERLPAQLSGGQQQRVAIARALAPNPAVLLMDEPFSSLDQSLRAQVRTEVLNILKKSGTSAIIVTHDIDDAFAMANRLLVLDKGRVAQFDTPRNTYLYPASAQVALLGGKVNIIDAELVGGSGGKVVIRPEHITVSQSGEWIITSAEFNGRYNEYQLTRGEKNLMLHSAELLSPGDAVSIQIDPKNIHQL